MRKNLIKLMAIMSITTLVVTGCSGNNNVQNNTVTESASEVGTSELEASEDTGSSTDSDVVSGNIVALSSESTIEVNTEFSARDLEVGYEESEATFLNLADNNIEVNGSGVSVQDNIITITKEGTYVLNGTLSNGQIMVDADEENDKIQIVLNGASITNKSNAAIYVKSADKVFLTIEAGTDNYLADGSEYVQVDENNVDGTIYSKSDITINGSGNLTIVGNYKHGVVSSDDVVITGGTINITAVKDAINGKDSVKIKDGILTLSAETGNGIQSKHDEDETKGYVYIAGGTITVIKSQEGIEGTAIVIAGGTIDITAEDDGLNAANGVSSTTTASTTVNNTQLVAQTSTLVSTTDNESSVDTTTSASVNTKGQMPEGERPTMPEGEFSQGERPNRGDETGAFGGGNGGMGGEFEVDSNCYISISGGTIYVNALGDGIDSNGSVYMSGGALYVSGPENSGNGSLDYNGNAEISGGIIVAAGSVGMVQGFSETSTQNSLTYNFASVSVAGTEVTVTDQNGTKIVSFTPSHQYQSVVISAPELTLNQTYTITSGSQSGEVTLSSVVTSGGEQSMGGMGNRP